MNWEMIGAVGELLGALGVIVTLAYLARQVRANTRALRQESEREAFDSSRLILSHLASNRELASIYRRGSGGLENLDPDERMQFGSLLLLMTYDWMRLEAFSRDQQVEPALVTTNRTARADLAKTPGYRQWFERQKHWLTPEFRSILEEEMGSSGPVHVPSGTET